MTMHERLRALGISPERLAVLGITPPPPKPPRTFQEWLADSLAGNLGDRGLADFTAWRNYRDETDAYRRARLRAENGAAIERGRQLDEQLLPPEWAEEK